MIAGESERFGKRKLKLKIEIDFFRESLDILYLFAELCKVDNQTYFK